MALTGAPPRRRGYAFCLLSLSLAVLLISACIVLVFESCWLQMCLLKVPLAGSLLKPTLLGLESVTAVPMNNRELPQEYRKVWYGTADVYGLSVEEPGRDRSVLAGLLGCDQQDLSPRHTYLVSPYRRLTDYYWLENEPHGFGVSCATAVSDQVYIYRYSRCFWCATRMLKVPKEQRSRTKTRKVK